jgi:phospholipase C
MTHLTAKPERSAPVPRLSTAAMVAAAATTVAVVTAMVPSAAAGSRTVAKSSGTPIKHLVVIFQENVSFDHYFGTYPRATRRTPPASPSTVAAIAAASTA